MNSRLEQFLKDRAAEAYEEKRTSGHDYLTEQMAAVVAPRLPVGGSVLDMGCGQGPALEWFTRHGFNPLGCTINGDDIAACVAANFSVAMADQNAMPKIWTAAFDCVWARHVLEHSPIPFFTLLEFNRVLKPGGILYAEMPLPDTACCHETNLNHYSVLTEGMWASLIARAGFTVEETRHIKLGTPVGPDEYVSFIAKKL